MTKNAAQSANDNKCRKAKHSDMTKNTILIVDDEPSFLETMVEIIENAGEPYKIFQALSAEVAYDIACKRLPDLIITDWEMPFMSGLELIDKLKSNPNTKTIPVIMCTGIMTSSRNLMTALEIGAVDYIRKPIDPLELISRIRSMLLLHESFKEIQHRKEALLNKENEFLEYKIECQTKELTANTLNSIKNQELLIGIAKELKEILALSKDEKIDKHIRSVVNSLNISNSDSTWEEFRKYFEKVHTDFFKNLNNSCPNLTSNEIKICALLKLNFSTKDISSITQQSTRSVVVARHRLRKKLKLPQEESLLSFVSQF